MIDQLLIVFLTISIYEFMKYVKLIEIIYSNLKIYKKILTLFKYKNTSDFKKEKLTLNYSRSLLISSTKIIIIILIIVIFIFLIGRLSSSFINFIISIYGLAEITVLFLFYHQLRKRINAKL